MNSTAQISSLAACASLVLAAPAAADIHIDPAGHGGKGPGSRAAAASAVAKARTFGGHSRQGLPVVAQVAARGRSVVVRAAMAPSCENGSSFDSVKFARTKVSKRGRFSVAKSIRTKFDDGYSVSESYKLTGKVTKTGGSGTYRVDDTWFDPQGQRDDTCHTGNVSFRVSDAGVFAGTTNDGSPVVLEVSPGVDRIKSLLIPWTADCRSGALIWDTASLTGPITAAGAFGGSLSPTLDLGGGLLAHETETLSGTVNRTSAFGTWRVQTSVVDATQTEMDTCDTGPLSFKLR